MKIGTKSVLFGVHQFLWHPFTVALAWRSWHGHWPRGKSEWVAIITHDLGYLGCPDMDGVRGKDHPLQSALFAWMILRRDRDARRHAMALVLGHSSHFCRQMGLPTSALYEPDKLCVLWEPRWFYLLRALASGEVWEFIAQAPAEVTAGIPRWRQPWVWLNWYRSKTKIKFYGKKQRQQCGNVIPPGEHVPVGGSKIHRQSPDTKLRGLHHCFRFLAPFDE